MIFGVLFAAIGARGALLSMIKITSVSADADAFIPKMVNLILIDWSRLATAVFEPRPVLCKKDDKVRFYWSSEEEYSLFRVHSEIGYAMCSFESPSYDAGYARKPTELTAASLEADHTFSCDSIGQHFFASDTHCRAAKFGTVVVDPSQGVGPSSGLRGRTAIGARPVVGGPDDGPCGHNNNILECTITTWS